MKRFFIGLTIILLAFFFRFNNLNWDSNFHLHPDERFLTMVGNAMKMPTSANQYFDQKTSLLNPANIGYNFFVYGHFPLILAKYLAVNLNLDNYNNLTILGRQLSAFFDLLIVLLVFKVTKLLLNFSHPERPKRVEGSRFRFLDFARNDSIALWAGFFYAIAVLPIQLSHFFAVDTFLNFFMFGSFYFVLRFWTSQNDVILVSDQRERIQNLILSAIFFGLALACKITALFILPLNLFFILKTVFVRRQSLIKTVGFVFGYLLASYFTIRLADPYIFQNSNILDPTVSKVFVENINSLKNMSVKNMNNWFPPMVQWLNKNTVLHSLVNNIIFGLGIPYAILTLIGMGLIISRIKNQISKIHTKNQKNNFGIFIILFWVIGLFIYQSVQATPALRYYILIYPFLAIFASLGMNFLIDYKLSLNGKHISYPKSISHIFISISIILLLLWPAMFSSIYFNKHTRVEASEWIYQNIPDGSFILSEYWDDALPLPVINTYGKRFSGTQLRVFDPDNVPKWQGINQELAMADYYILSSNRGWGSIPTVPKKYPLMSKFYNELLADKNPDFKKIKEFRPYYNKFFQLPDDWVDESFTVYDQPTVIIFKKSF